MGTRTTPLPIQLEVEFLDRLSEPVREGRAASVSEIIRAALERFDFSNIVVLRSPQVAISVRLAPEIRRNLKHLARTKHTSIGQLVRTAVEAYLPQLESGQLDQMEIATVPPPAITESVLAAPPPPRKKKRAPRPRPARGRKARPKKAAPPRRRPKRARRRR